jgi:hypothetical protein
MKPTFQLAEPRNARGCFRSRNLSRSLQTDYSYQASRFGGSGHCGGKPQPSFRGISDDYFRREARGHFKSEAAFFALIALTVAVPVVQSIYAVLTLVYAGL